MQIGTYQMTSTRSTITGIVNVTPDSFYDGGKYNDAHAAIQHALALCGQGADILDVGGESSRPGAIPISVEEELRRVIPVIEGVRRSSAVPISIDTCKASVAQEAIKAGADMINDISAGERDPHILRVAAESRVPICLMHMRGTPEAMQQNVDYDDLIGEICSFFQKAIMRAERAGVCKEQIILDPGVGFGKSPKGNIDILRRLDRLTEFRRPVLLGTSRKSFIGKLLGHPPEERLEATLATLSFARRTGIQCFRVHDVAAARRYLDMVDLLEGGHNPSHPPLILRGGEKEKR